MLTISTSSEQIVLLPNLSWKLYEDLLAELGNQRSTRIAYHQGQLEILENGEYGECDFSLAWTMLPMAKVDEFIDRTQTAGATAAVREFREWVRNR